MPFGGGDETTGTPGGGVDGVGGTMASEYENFGLLSGGRPSHEDDDDDYSGGGGGGGTDGGDYGYDQHPRAAALGGAGPTRGRRNVQFMDATGSARELLGSVVGGGGIAEGEEEEADEEAGPYRSGGTSRSGSGSSSSSGGGGGYAGGRRSSAPRYGGGGGGGAKHHHGWNNQHDDDDWDASAHDDDEYGLRELSSTGRSSSIPGRVVGRNASIGSVGSYSHRPAVAPRGAIESARQFLWEDADDDHHMAMPSHLDVSSSPRGSFGAHHRPGGNGHHGGAVPEDGGGSPSSTSKFLTTRNIDWGGGGGGASSSEHRSSIGGVGGIGGGNGIIAAVNYGIDPHDPRQSFSDNLGGAEEAPLASVADTVATVFGPSSARLVMPARGMSNGGGSGDLSSSRFPRPEDVEASKQRWSLKRTVRNVREARLTKKNERKKKELVMAGLPDMSVGSSGNGSGSGLDFHAAAMQSVNFHEESMAMNLAPKRGSDLDQGGDDGGRDDWRERWRTKGKFSGGRGGGRGSNNRCCSFLDKLSHSRKKSLLVVALAVVAGFTIAVVLTKGDGKSGDASSLGVSPDSAEGATSQAPTRLQLVHDLVVSSGHTDPSLLNDGVNGGIGGGTTAQSKALRWIAEWDGARLDVDDPMVLPRYSLAVFFFSTYVATKKEEEEKGGVETADGSGAVGGLALGEEGHPEIVPNSEGEEVWYDATHWMTARGYCSWAGVRCRPLNGTDDATYDGNGIVTHLNLTSNGVRGTLPSELSALTDLTIIDLMENEISGTLPTDLGTLTKLISVSLSNNDISGSIPAEFGGLTALTHLYLDRNVLEGPVPEEIGNLESMHVLGLYENYLTGSFPPLQKMKHLRSLYLDDNQLTGTIPGGVLGELTAMEDLRLGTNNFTGPIPSQIGNLASLSVAYMEYNALSGTIPWEIYKLKELDEFHLHENYLSGTIPYQFGELRDLEVLYLDHNSLTGTIPAPLGDMDDMMELYLQGNQLTGTIPPLLTRLEDLVDLRLDSNKLSGPIPRDIKRLFKLEFLHLNDNALTGSPPESLGDLSRLRGLRLNGNKLQGEMPEGLCQLTKNGGDLKLLQADCGGDEPAVVCGCCTECFE